ncbi:MAG: DUF63 family protein [Candidatus Aenigmatarchaeota archaeon]|nr:MAG: DUF63 family protein [Candidatus Aenigmarchaeota archaeon]
MDFLYEYFLKPILSNGWFNPVNSITYGIILVVGVYLVFKLLKRMNIHVDLRFLYAILPFILWGASTRVLHDAAYYGALTGKLGEFYSLPIFPTPGSYLITFLLALIVLLISLTVQRYARFPYWKTMLAVGIILNIINFALFPRINPIPMLMVLGITGLWSLLFLLLYKFSQTSKFQTLKQIFTLENSGLLSSHMLDASATYVAMTFFGYLEQHPLPRFLIGMTNPAAMFLLKLVVLIPVLYIIDKYSEPGDFKNFLKIVVLILGLAPGLRDMIRLMVGV